MIEHRFACKNRKRKPKNSSSILNYGMCIFLLFQGPFVEISKYILYQNPATVSNFLGYFFWNSLYRSTLLLNFYMAKRDPCESHHLNLINNAESHQVFVKRPSFPFQAVCKIITTTMQNVWRSPWNWAAANFQQKGIYFPNF